MSTYPSGTGAGAADGMPRGDMRADAPGDMPVGSMHGAASATRPVSAGMPAGAMQPPGPTGTDAAGMPVGRMPAVGAEAAPATRGHERGKGNWNMDVGPYPSADVARAPGC